MAIASFGKAEFGLSSGIGQAYLPARFDAEATALPFQGEGGARTRYVVPAGVKVAVQAVQVVADRSWCASPGNAGRAGVALLRVNGVTRMEWAVYETGWWEPTGALAYKLEQRRGGGVHCWDVAFSPGDVIVLRFTPTSSTGCVLAVSDISGSASGAAVCVSGRNVINGSPATDLITYTVPAGGFTLKRLCLQAFIRGAPACPFISLLVKNQIVAEVPTWRAVDSSGAPPRIAIQMGGLELYPGDTIELRASSLWRMDEWAGLTVFGTSSDLATCPVYPTLAAVTAAIPGIVLPGTPPTPSDPPTATDYAWAALQGVVA